MLVGCLGKGCSRYYTLDKVWPFPPLSSVPGNSGLACFYQLFSAAVAEEVLQPQWGGCRGAAALPPVCRTRQLLSSDPGVFPLPWDLGEPILLLPQHPLQSISLAGGKCQVSCSSAKNFPVSLVNDIPQDRGAEQLRKIQTYTNTTHTGNKKGAMQKQPKALDSSNILVWL